MKKFFGEFKEFITKGNVMDMAVGSIIGLSFKDLVTSFTNDIISPILGIFGGVDFSDMKWVIGTKEVLDEAGNKMIVENSINYGAFVTGVINFLIMALVIFFMVKLVAAVSGWSKKLIKKDEAEAPVEEAPAPETSEDILKDIRELLKAQNASEETTTN